MYVQEWFEISYLMMWSSPLPIKLNFTLGLQIQLFDIQYTKKKKKKEKKKRCNYLTIVSVHHALI